MAIYTLNDLLSVFQVVQNVETIYFDITENLITENGTPHLLDVLWL